MQAVFLIYLDICLISGDKGADFSGLQVRRVRDPGYQHHVSIMVRRLHTVAVDGKHAVGAVNFPGSVQPDGFALVLKLCRIAEASCQGTGKIGKPAEKRSIFRGLYPDQGVHELVHGCPVAGSKLPVLFDMHLLPRRVLLRGIFQTEEIVHGDMQRLTQFGDQVQVRPSPAVLPVGNCVAGNADHLRKLFLLDTHPFPE